MGELLALKWEDIDFSTAQLHVRRTINRLAKYESHDGENKTEIVFGTPKTKNSRRTIPLTRTMADELARWKQQQAQDKQRAGDKYTDDGFIVTNEFGHYFEQKTFKDYYDRLLKDADIGHFTFHALRHTFATRALERGMDYKTLSAILGHYSVAFTMDTYVHSINGSMDFTFLGETQWFITLFTSDSSSALSNARLSSKILQIASISPSLMWIISSVTSRYPLAVRSNSTL